MLKRIQFWGNRPFQFFELAMVCCATPLLLFANQASRVGLVLLGITWLVHFAANSAPRFAIHTSWPLVGLMLMTILSLYPSTDLSLSLPKYYGLLLGYSLYAVAQWNLRGSRDLGVIVGILTAGGAAVAMIGLVGTDWLVPKVSLLAPIYAHLPRLIDSVQTSQRITSGFHPNELAGTLTLLLPVAAALTIYTRVFWYRVLLSLSVLLMTFVTALTFSRSATLGAGIGLITIALIRWPRLTFGLVLMLAAATVVFWRVGPTGYLTVLVGLPTGSDIPGVAATRLEIWNRAINMIQDFPLTGIGLNTFPLVLASWYPAFINNAVIPHAHNLFLQTAVDLGLPGLLCFICIIAMAGYGLIRSIRSLTGWEKGAVIGLGAGLIAHLVFGLTDAVALGAKPGVFLWIELGAAAGVPGLVKVTCGHNTTGGRKHVDFLACIVFNAAVLISLLIF